MSFHDDPYRVLGLSRDAGVEDLEKAFRRLALKYHPDKTLGDAGAEERYSRITAAYTYLKRLMTTSEAGWINRGAGAGGQEGGGDGANVFMGSHARSVLSKQCVDVTITLKESFVGTSRCIKVGNKRIFSSPRKRTVIIPAGVCHQTVLRIPDACFPVFPNEPKSDLFVRLHVKRDRRFSCAGPDIYTNRAVSKKLCVKGGTVTVAMPQGKCKLRVPPHTQPRTVFRLRGLGLPSGAVFRKTGDFFVQLVPRRGLLAFLFSPFSRKKSRQPLHTEAQDPFWQLHSSRSEKEWWDRLP